MTTRRVFFLALILLPSCFPANLAVSSYFKDGFSPAAVASDPQGNIYVAGTAVIDPAAQASSVAVAKLDPNATGYLYLTYLDSASTDYVAAIAVDAAGNAYITGGARNPNFPSTGGTLGTPPTDPNDTRPFLTKLSPTGAVVYSVLLGGSVQSRPFGIALTPQGQILVSGIADATGFPTTAGAYSVADSKNHWFLMEVDATASKVLFSATGIGGSSIALDAAGNIYLAGSSIGTDYPTTPGAYQTTFTQGYTCGFPCQIEFPGTLQHVTKVDPTASRLIFSTGLNDLHNSSGNTTNTGIAVDTDGNVYVTGFVAQGTYPFTVNPPTTDSAFLSKLDPTGSTVAYSLPVGGAGVRMDSSGNLYVGGLLSNYRQYTAGFAGIAPVPPPAPLSWVPQYCWPNEVVAGSAAYIARIDPATGAALDAQWIGGSGPTAIGLTLADGKAWIVGSTPAADVPMTPGALMPSALGGGQLSGAFLAAADFSTVGVDSPAVACVLDSANLSQVRAVTGQQLISLFGRNLGQPGAADVSLNDVSAQLLYVSSTQINVVVPVQPYSVAPRMSVMKLTVDGVTTARQFPYIASNPSLFGNLSPQPCGTATEFEALAVNADGSLNSCTAPAHAGDQISLFVQGTGGPLAPSLLGLVAHFGQCAATVENASLIGGLVYRVDVRLPSTVPICAGAFVPDGIAQFGFVHLSYGDIPVGPTTLAGSPMILGIWAQ